MSHLPCQVTCLITLISPFREDNYQVPKIIFTLARCLKITEKVYTLKLEACSQIVLPDRSVLIGQKLVENAKMSIFKQCVPAGIGAPIPAGSQKFVP